MFLLQIVALFFLFCAMSGANADARIGLGLTLPVAEALAVEDDGEQAQLFFSLSQPLVAEAFVLANPDRVVISLPEVLFQIDPEVGKARSRQHRGSSRSIEKAQGLIRSFRFGLVAAGRSRIVIDLYQPAQIVSAASTLDAGGAKNQFMIVLKKTDRTSFLKTAQAVSQNVSAEPKVPAAQPANDTGPVPAQIDPLPAALPVIVIDPGHGGVDSGAMVKGFVEKDLVFEFAKSLRQKLEALGCYKVMMTRNTDIFISLGDRVKIARDANAALFISIHADSLPESNENVGGATVYTVSERASDAEAARVAEKENEADAIAGLDSKEDANEVTGILSDLARRETRTFSHVFAGMLVNYWKGVGRLNKNPQRSAGFRVLRAPDVPSVLLELGYLSNSKDSFAIHSPEWQDKASKKVMQAVEDFFTSHPSLTASPGAEESPGEPEQGLDLRKLIGGDEASGSGSLAAELPSKPH